MNWEETIVHLRSLADYQDILRDSYLEEDLFENANRFELSGEFKETLLTLKKYLPLGRKLLDVGAGNGIATVAFARNGYIVAALEPDPSETVGAGAIRKLVDGLSLKEVAVVGATAEQMPFPDHSFDIVYVRQAMHHASHLKNFIKECARVLKPGGVLFTIRDHVVFDQNDKQRCLQEHPLHKYYGGENAFSDPEYRSAMKDAGLDILLNLGHFESIINYFPQSPQDIANLPSIFKEQLNSRAARKYGIIGKFGPFRYIYRKAAAIKFGGALDEKRIPGRLHSYIARKPNLSS